MVKNVYRVVAANRNTRQFEKCHSVIVLKGLDLKFLKNSATITQSKGKSKRVQAQSY
jgi:hypothetical protein